MNASSNMPPQLSTPRLLLNLLTEQDHAFILSLLNSEGWLQFIGDRNVHSKEDAIAYSKKISATPDLFYWVVRTKENNVPIGIVSFLKRRYLEHFDLGFAFLPSFTGQGYAFEAAKEVMVAVTKEGRHSLLLAVTAPQNNSSIKLLNKLGFRFQNETEGQSGMVHVYSRPVDKAN